MHLTAKLRSDTESVSVSFTVPDRHRTNLFDPGADEFFDLSGRVASRWPCCAPSRSRRLPVIPDDLGARRTRAAPQRARPGRRRDTSIAPFATRSSRNPPPNSLGAPSAPGRSEPMKRWLSPASGHLADHCLDALTGCLDRLDVQASPRDGRVMHAHD
ncbi:MAG: hypothetical protein QOF69_3963, partial [Solirubrobacteraceae bacterium]|nr:hypothetical protein [Solirubrobacteraceae bacterium]